MRLSKKLFRRPLALLLSLVLLLALLPTMASAVYEDTYNAKSVGTKDTSQVGIPVGEGKRINLATKSKTDFGNLDNGTWYFFLDDSTVTANAATYGDKTKTSVKTDSGFVVNAASTSATASAAADVAPYYNGDAMRDVVFSEHLGLWTEATLDYALWIPDSYVNNPDGNFALVLNDPVSQKELTHPAAITNTAIKVASSGGSGGGGGGGGNPETNIHSDYFISDAGIEQVKDAYGLDGIFVLRATIANAGRVQNDSTLPTQYSLLLLLIDALLENYPIDSEYIYATGESVGGMILPQINTHRDNFLAGYVINGSQWYQNFYKDTVFNAAMISGSGNNANPSRLERHYTLTDDRIIWDFNEGGEYDYLAWQNIYYMTSDDNLLVLSTDNAWNDWSSVIKGLTGYDFARVPTDTTGSNLLANIASTPNKYNGSDMGLVWATGLASTGSDSNPGVGNFAVGKWLLSQTRQSQIDRPKLDINRPFDGTPGTSATSTASKFTGSYQYTGIGAYFWVPAPGAGSLFYNSIPDGIRPPGWLPTKEMTSTTLQPQGATELLSYPVNGAKIQSVRKVSADGTKLIVAIEYDADMENAVIHMVGDKVVSEFGNLSNAANTNGFVGTAANFAYPRADFVVLDTFDFYNNSNGTKINDLYNISVGQKPTVGVDNPEYITAMSSRISKIYFNDLPAASSAAGDRTGKGKYVIVEINTSADPDSISVIQRAPIIAPAANALASADYRKVASLSFDASLTSVANQVITEGNEAGNLSAPKTAAISVANAKSSIVISDIIAASGAISEIYTDSSYTAAAASKTLTSGGATVVYIKVSAEDGLTMTYYAVTVNRAAANNSDSGSGDYYIPPTVSPTPSPSPTPSTTAITRKPDGTGGFTATVNKTYIYAQGKFTDVAANAWYADNVKFVYEYGLMNGTSAYTFSPGADCTRAMIITVLARAAGINTDGGTEWYSKAVLWAVQTGVSDGTNLSVNITREQLVTMLWRFSGSPIVSATIPFPDANKISTYAIDAAKWGISKGIITGSNGLFNPQGNATRAETAAILGRYLLNT